MRLASLLLWFTTTALGVAAGGEGDIYPEKHFDYVTAIEDEEHLISFVQSHLDQKRSVFVRWVPSYVSTPALKQAPSWNDVTKMFAGNNNDNYYGVAFAEVNLEETEIRGKHYPGSQGWPTIKYFTPETGVEGARYERQTEKPIAEELLDRNRMIDYVEDYGNTVLCSREGTNCNEKELAYLEKMKSEDAEILQQKLERLEGMMDKAMSPELQEWALRRMRILNRLMKKSGSGNEKKKKKKLKDEIPRKKMDVEAFLCKTDGANCNEMELEYLEKMKNLDVKGRKKEFDRLKTRTEKHMSTEFQDFIFRRMRILKKLIKESGDDNEKDTQAMFEAIQKGQKGSGSGRIEL
jgi:hypothetical protein